MNPVKSKLRHSEVTSRPDDPVPIEGAWWIVSESRQPGLPSISSSYEMDGGASLAEAQAALERARIADFEQETQPDPSSRDAAGQAPSSYQRTEGGNQRLSTATGVSAMTYHEYSGKTGNEGDVSPL